MERLEKHNATLSHHITSQDTEIRRLRGRVQTLLREKKSSRVALRDAKREHQRVAAERDAAKAEAAREADHKVHWKRKHTSQRRVSEELARRGARWKREVVRLRDQVAELELSFDALQRRNRQLVSAAATAAEAKAEVVERLTNLHAAAQQRAQRAETRLAELGGSDSDGRHVPAFGRAAGDGSDSSNVSPSPVAPVAAISPKSRIVAPAARRVGMLRGSESKRHGRGGAPADPAPPAAPASPAGSPLITSITTHGDVSGAASPMFPRVRKSRLFEAFVVTGVPHGPGAATKPEVLWTFPADTQITPLVADLCYPDGAHARTVDVSSSISDFQSALFGRGKGSRGPGSHCFLMSGGLAGVEDTRLYGVCLKFEEPVVREGDDSAIDMFPRCYCLITRHPFLRLHFHVLQVLLGMYKEELLIRQASGGLGQSAAAANDPLRLPSPRTPDPDPVPAPAATPTPRKRAQFGFLKFDLPRMPSFRSPRPDPSAAAEGTVGRRRADSAPASAQPSGGGQAEAKEDVRPASAVKAGAGASSAAAGVGDTGAGALEPPSYEPPERVATIVSRYYRARVPPPGGELLVSLSTSAAADANAMRESSLQFRRKSVAELRLLSGRTHAEREMSFEVLWWAVPVVLSFMPLHNVLQIVGAALTEHKVLIVGGSVCMDAVSSVALCMIPLLQPLAWTGAILPVLPDAIAEMVQTPTPLIAGLPRLPEHLPLDEGTVVVNLETNTVDLCDTIAYLQVQLPDVTKLYHDLSQFSNHTLGDASGGGSTNGPPTPVLVYGEERVAEAFGFVRRMQQHTQRLLSAVFPPGERTAALQRVAALVKSRPEVEQPFWTCFCRSQMVDFFHQNRACAGEGAGTEMEEVRQSLALRSTAHGAGTHASHRHSHQRHRSHGHSHDGGKSSTQSAAAATAAAVLLPSQATQAQADSDTDSSTDDSDDSFENYLVSRRSSLSSRHSQQSRDRAHGASAAPEANVAATQPSSSAAAGGGASHGGGSTGASDPAAGAEPSTSGGRTQLPRTPSRLAVDRRARTPMTAKQKQEVMRRRLARRRSKLNVVGALGGTSGAATASSGDPLSGAPDASAHTALLSPAMSEPRAPRVLPFAPPVAPPRTVDHTSPGATGSAVPARLAGRGAAHATALASPIDATPSRGLQTAADAAAGRRASGTRRLYPAPSRVQLRSLSMYSAKSADAAAAWGGQGVAGAGPQGGSQQDAGGDAGRSRRHSLEPRRTHVSPSHRRGAARHQQQTDRSRRARSPVMTHLDTLHAGGGRYGSQSGAVRVVSNADLDQDNTWLKYGGDTSDSSSTDSDDAPPIAGARHSGSGSRHIWSPAGEPAQRGHVRGAALGHSHTHARASVPGAVSSPPAMTGAQQSRRRSRGSSHGSIGAVSQDASHAGIGMHGSAAVTSPVSGGSPPLPPLQQALSPAAVAALSRLNSADHQDLAIPAQLFPDPGPDRA